jgi:hypothetical protein
MLFPFKCSLDVYGKGTPPSEIVVPNVCGEMVQATKLRLKKRDGSRAAIPNSRCAGPVAGVVLSSDPRLSKALVLLGSSTFVS